MQWYQPGDHEENVFTINTDSVDLADVQDATLLSIAHTLAFPLNSLGDTDTFDQLVTAMTDQAKEHTDPTAPRPEVGSVLKRFGITPNTEDYALLAETFTTLCDLNAEGRDSIWGLLHPQPGSPPVAIYARQTSRCTDRQPAVGGLSIHDLRPSRRSTEPSPTVTTYGTVARSPPNKTWWDCSSPAVWPSTSTTVAPSASSPHWPSCHAKPTKASGPGDGELSTL